ncbi:MAG: hypothetical protein BMS9Abin34_461 [Patescibacteria group bacterium]|nr:MAG: hypothetical protein BMS9Abin34_461 [Patescibacteria group bacterium]
MPKRRLVSREVSEARLVFGNTVHYSQVLVMEGWKWLNRVVRMIALIRCQPPPTADYALGLGNSVRFARPLKPGNLEDTAWLIHELTHVWQFQHFGWIYLLEASQAHVYLGAEAYNYGGETGLARALKEERSLYDFNPEQQGNICRDYYVLLKSGEPTLLWEPFIQDLRRSK